MNFQIQQNFEISLNHVQNSLNDFEQFKEEFNKNL